MNPSERTDTDLFAAVEQQINLGLQDPIAIAKGVRKLHGDDWLSEQLMAYADDLLEDIARHRLADYRHNAELGREYITTAGPVAISNGTTKIRQRRKTDLMLASKWVPDEHGGFWKKLGDFTIKDCQAVAKHYRMLSRAHEQRAELYEDYARQLKKEGVECLGELSVVPKLAEVA